MNTNNKTLQRRSDKAPLRGSDEYRTVWDACNLIALEILKGNGRFLSSEQLAHYILKCKSLNVNLSRQTIQEIGKVYAKEYTKFQHRVHNTKMSCERLIQIEKQSTKLYEKELHKILEAELPGFPAEILQRFPGDKLC
jgi:hypothetical protein